MPDPNLAVPESNVPDWLLRYNDRRARKYEHRAEQLRSVLPGLRTRRTRRTLVVGLVLTLLLATCASVASFWFITATWIPFLVGIVGSIVFFTLLRILSGAFSDAPANALDELQLAQRNAARSLAFMLFVPLMLTVYAISIGLSFRDWIAGQTMAALAWLMISGTLAVACLPDILLSWWMSDDPDDEE